MTGQTMTAGGVQVWYAERGTGEPLLMLHPGGVDSRAFDPNLAAFATRFHVFTPDRRAHGRTRAVEGPLTYAVMADDTTALIETLGLGRVHLLGCSDGAVVALLLALRRPDLVRKVAFV